MCPIKQERLQVALYARVSTVKQAEKDLSIPDQLRQMRDFCSQHKHVDEDRKRWVKLYYGVEADAYTNYDLVFNLERLDTENAAAMAAALCELLDFQISPGSRKAMRDLLLAAQARLALAEDETTFDTSLTVRATDGVVSVVYGIRDGHHTVQRFQGIPEA